MHGAARGTRDTGGQGLRNLLVKCLLQACEWRLELREMVSRALGRRGEGERIFRGACFAGLGKLLNGREAQYISTWIVLVYDKP